jgi:hypothetical protein
MKGMEGHERKVGEGEEFEFKNYIPTRCLINLSGRYTHNDL